ncbi:MAG: uroporphyrinogen-III C-methyltransferase [Verrucomicrobia bacterium]|nr:uroporphyrinogen-III C-methyltransferase [Verrucomicrobiota bacterium]
MQPKGMVYLVGAGPGDAGLLTLRGAELLGRADVVIYDGLVNHELLRLAPAAAELIYGGKHDRARALSQDTLNDLLLSKAREGKTVVRLKGGDPYVFGRGGEEAEMLEAAGIPFEVVPGVSSAEAVPNYAGIPLTHRACCSSYTVVTGHEDPDKDQPQIDWAHLARIPGTLVVLMGARQIRAIATALMANGRSPDTPVAMIRWGTLGRQRTLEGTLTTIADLADRAHFTLPAVIVIGEVVKLRRRLNWFETRPLFGQRIVVTRARDQAAPLVRALQELGAEVLEVPTIRIGPPTNKVALVEALVGLNAYDWLVFTSVNGVTAFFEYFFKQFQDMRDIGGVRLAAVGPGTAARLREFRLQVDLMPKEATAAQVARSFATFESMENRRVLLMRAEVANPELPKLLEDLGAIVDDVACYRTEPATDDPCGAASKLIEKGADWITFTSGSTVEQFHQRFNLPKLTEKFPALRLVSIGPETSKALAALGLRPAIEARSHTVEGLVTALRTAARAASRAHSS